MFGYDEFSFQRAIRIKLSDFGCKTIRILAIQFFPAFCFSCSTALPHFAVAQTLFLSLFQRLLFDQQALPLIALARPTPS
jgi:hypothetical protein